MAAGCGEGHRGRWATLRSEIQTEMECGRRGEREAEEPLLHEGNPLES